MMTLWNGFTNSSPYMIAMYCQISSLFRQLYSNLVAQGYIILLSASFFGNSLSDREHFFYRYAAVPHFLEQQTDSPVLGTKDCPHTSHCF